MPYLNHLWKRYGGCNNHERLQVVGPKEQGIYQQRWRQQVQRGSKPGNPVLPEGLAVKTESVFCQKFWAFFTWFLQTLVNSRTFWNGCASRTEKGPDRTTCGYPVNKQLKSFPSRGRQHVSHKTSVCQLFFDRLLKYLTQLALTKQSLPKAANNLSQRQNRAWTSNPEKCPQQISLWKGEQEGRPFSVTFSFRFYWETLPTMHRN